jgi:hypothetical protein
MPEPDDQLLGRHVPSRDVLLNELQAAHTKRFYDSPVLRKAVADFTHGARHSGLRLEWVLTAVQDAIDTGVLPPLDEARRRAISERVRRMVTEAYASCMTEHTGDTRATPSLR